MQIPFARYRPSRFWTGWILLLLAVQAGLLLTFWWPYHREQQVVAQIERSRGFVRTKNFAPAGLQRHVHPFWLSPFDRVTQVCIKEEVSDELLSSLEVLYRLDQLTFWKTDLTEEQLKQVAGLTHLKDFGMVSSRLDDAALRHLSNLQRLETLTLESENIGDEGIRSLRSLNSLRRLWLYNTNVTQDGVDALAEALPICSIYLQSKNESHQVKASRPPPAARPQSTLSQIRENLIPF